MLATFLTGTADGRVGNGSDTDSFVTKDALGAAVARIYTVIEALRGDMRKGL